MTYSATVPFFSNHFDIVFAIYSFVSLTALHILLLKYTQQINLTSIIISFFQTILLLLPLLEIIYFIYYGSCISEAAIMAIYQTNPEEAKEWLSVTFGYTGLLFIFSVYKCYFLYLLQIKYQKYNQKHNSNIIKKTINLAFNNVYWCWFLLNFQCFTSNRFITCL